MTSTPHQEKLNDVSFMFTKLIVNDLESSAAFYSSVCGLTEMHRIEAEIAGRGVSEIVFSPSYSGGPMLILAKFKNTSQPASDEVMLGFASQDLEGVVDRVMKAGGRVVEPIRDHPQSGMRTVFVADGEGHILQVTQMLDR